MKEMMKNKPHATASLKKGHNRLGLACVLAMQVLLLNVTIAFAQDSAGLIPEKTRKESVNLTYEGNEELANDKFEDAEIAFRKAIATNDQNAVARYNLGNAYYNKNTLGEAFIRFKEAGENFEAKGGRHKAYHNLGNVFMKNEEYQKAVEAYKEALRNDPADEETRYNLALAKEMLKKQQNEENKDQNKEDNEKDQKDNKDDQKDQQDKKEQQDKGDQDQNQDDGQQKEQEQDQSENKQDQQQQKPEQPKDQEGQPKQQQSQLSPQQIKNILEAMNNEEKKVQEKINAKKVKGKPVRAEKDW